MILTDEQWRFRATATLDWLKKSLKATGYQGSSHSLQPLLGWEKAYPETTGYLIETLRHYAAELHDEQLNDLADGCERWLEQIQLPEGAFPGLLIGNTTPSVFNTSQILFGLSPDGAASKKAVTWLLEMLEPDGLWKKAAYVPGFVPVYYTRAVWALLKSDPATASLMHRSLRRYGERFLPNGGLRDAGFSKGEKAFTHTIAYALEGFWESALLLHDTRIQQQTLHSLECLLAERERSGGRTAGRYDEQWRGDYRFVCVAGNCQLSILCHKIGQATGEERWLKAAEALLLEILSAQRTKPGRSNFGALPGSVPFWGAYLPFRYPNWAAKFFLDALLRMRSLT